MVQTLLFVVGLQDNAEMDGPVPVSELSALYARLAKIKSRISAVLKTLKSSEDVDAIAEARLSTLKNEEAFLI